MEAQAKKMGAKTAPNDVARNQEIQATKVIKEAVFEGLNNYEFALVTPIVKQFGNICCYHL